MSEVLYRKHRPQSLKEIKGQGHIKTILLNAIGEKKVAHAYLFSGARGVGKTTTARILASSLGVEGVDLTEIDAASNRGIDDIRDLRETVYYQPSQSEVKVYILDEVHMLTNEAFNALLKVLEEPPAYVYFILCTTEPYKIPLTIISRLQHLNFSSGNYEELASYVEEISAKEGYELSSEAAKEIALKSQGSYRDALVILDKAMSYNPEGMLSPIEVLRVTGGVSASELDDFVNKVVQRELEGLYSWLKNIESQGTDISRLLDSMSDHVAGMIFRDDSINNNSMTLEDKDAIDLLECLNSARVKSSYSSAKSAVVMSEIYKYFKKTRDVVIEVEQKITMPEKVSKSPKGLDVREEVLIQPVENGLGELEILQRESNNKKTTVKSIQGLEMVEREWRNILAEVKIRKNNLQALLLGARPLNIDDQGAVVLSFNYQFHKSKIEEIGNRQIIEESFEKILSVPIRIKCVLGKKETVSEMRKEQPLPVETTKMPDEFNYQPVVKTKKIRDEGGGALLSIAQEYFGGQLIE